MENEIAEDSGRKQKEKGIKYAEVVTQSLGARPRLPEDTTVQYAEIDMRATLVSCWSHDHHMTHAVPTLPTGNGSVSLCRAGSSSSLRISHHED